MKPQPRPYRHPEDYDRVNDFLVRTYSTAGPHQNWTQPRWEYMHYHPLLDPATLPRIGVWEVEGNIVGLVHHEHRLGVVYFEFAPGHDALRPDMLNWALEHLAGTDEHGPFLACYVDDRDTALQQAARDRGLARSERHGEATSVLALDRTLPASVVPPGFLLTDVARNDDIEKLHRLLHRGFNNPGEPDAADLPGRRRMQSAPNYRRDLNVIVLAPDGGFASLCGMWYEPVNRFAYVEPVCTDPAYRRMGLGRAAVLEGCRRCAALGATVAYSGVLEFYLSMGFRQSYVQHRWVKRMPHTAVR